MTEYPHIDSVYKRDGRGKFLMGEFSTPEFEYLLDNLWTWTEKIDGTNIRIMWDGITITLGGKTDAAQIPNRLVNHLNQLIDSWRSTYDEFAEDTLFKPGVEVCLYGEGFGAGIQKGGGNYGPDQRFILFDVKIGKWWLKREDVVEIAVKLGIPYVPSVGTMTLREAIKRVSEGFVSFYSIETPQLVKVPQFFAEGLVGQPVIPLLKRNGERVIVKIKHKDFVK